MILARGRRSRLTPPERHIVKHGTLVALTAHLLHLIAQPPLGRLRRQRQNQPTGDAQVPNLPKAR